MCLKMMICELVVVISIKLNNNVYETVNKKNKNLIKSSGFMFRGLEIKAE